MEEFKNLQETKLTSQPIFDGDVLHIYKDTVRLREVTPGVRTDSLTVIDKGLAAGEVVVVDGVDRLRDGLRVRVTASMETPRVTVPDTGSGE